MAMLKEYHRPCDLSEAMAMLTEGAGRLAPLAGGTWLVGQLETRAIADLQGVVDLRDLGLGVVRQTENSVQLGAMCRLSAMVNHPLLRDLANGLLPRAARGEGPVNLLNAATIGGLVACAEYDSELYTALLALGATATVCNADGTLENIPLAELDVRDRLITELLIPVDRYDSRYGGAARVARSPSDRPIVAAYAVADRDRLDEPTVALCGVATSPVLSGTPLSPPDNFKGSRPYRLEMAEIVAKRAIAETARALHDAT